MKESPKVFRDCGCGGRNRGACEALHLLPNRHVRHAKPRPLNPSLRNTFHTATAMVDFDNASLESCSTISSTATEPNRPGPGRTLGLLFDNVGQSIENQYSRARRGARRGSMTIPSGDPLASVPFEFVNPAERRVYEASVSTLSTTATASNLPGAGRTLGLLYDSVGTRVGIRISRLAVRNGYGPKETFAQIQGELQTAEDEEGRLVNTPLDDILRKKSVEKLMKRLIGYTKCVYSFHRFRVLLMMNLQVKCTVYPARRNGIYFIAIACTSLHPNTPFRTRRESLSPKCHVSRFQMASP